MHQKSSASAPPTTLLTLDTMIRNVLSPPPALLGASAPSPLLIGSSTVGVEMTYFSPDGEMGFPGNLAVTVRYTLDDANRLRLHYSAVCDRATPVNLTNHVYFNLAGAGMPSVLEHVATLNASRFTPVDKTMIPTGGLESVANTPLDFMRPRRIGDAIDDDHEQLIRADLRDVITCFSMSRSSCAGIADATHAPTNFSPRGDKIFS